MSTETTLLSMRNLVIEADSNDAWRPIVDGIDLTVKRGEVLGLIGESGAGKSTLGLAALGFTRPGCRIASGSIVFDGLDLRQANPAQLQALRGARIAYVAQSAAAAFNPARQLMDQYCETAITHGRSPATVEREAVARFSELLLQDPEHIGYRYPHQVSGGQLQRAMTAMAMACEPDLIVFDEPTTALDVTTQIEVLAAIRNIVRLHHSAAIYISHDLAVVAQLADRIMVLKDGVLVEEGETRHMLAAPAEDYTRTLWAVRSLERVQKPLAQASQIPVIAVEGLDAGYGHLRVLSDVSLKVHRARTVAVVGESGSGKSTLARCITGLTPPRRGSILYKGNPLPPDHRARTRDQLRHVQMIYQSPDTALNPRQSIRVALGRPVEFYLGLHGRQRDERIRELLAAIELEPDKYVDRLPGELSGGQKQRVSIARALAADPDLVICDEPTSALDQIVQEGILRLLDRLQREFGLSYLFITHDLATVKAIADEVVVMNRGVVVESGPKSEVFSPPQHPYTQRLLASVPEMDPDWLTRTLADRDSRPAGAS